MNIKTLPRPESDLCISATVRIPIRVPIDCYFRSLVLATRLIDDASNRVVDQRESRRESRAIKQRGKLAVFPRLSAARDFPFMMKTLFAELKIFVNWMLLMTTEREIRAQARADIRRNQASVFHLNGFKSENHLLPYTRRIRSDCEDVVTKI